MTCPERKSSKDQKRKEGREKEARQTALCISDGNVPSVPRQLPGDRMAERLDTKATALPDAATDKPAVVGEDLCEELPAPLPLQLAGDKGSKGTREHT